jgi:hypothetical protein
MAGYAFGFNPPLDLSALAGAQRHRTDGQGTFDRDRQTISTGPHLTIGARETRLRLFVQGSDSRLDGGYPPAAHLIQAIRLGERLQDGERLFQILPPILRFQSAEPPKRNNRKHTGLDIAGIASDQDAVGAKRTFKARDRVGGAALPRVQVANPLIGTREVVPPTGIAGVDFGKAASDGEGGLEAVERGLQVALRDEHVADPIIGEGDVALAAGISGVGFGEAVSDGQGGLEAVVRGRQIALRDEHVADLVMGDRKVARPAGIAGVCLDETAGNGEGGLLRCRLFSGIQR